MSSTAKPKVTDGPIGILGGTFDPVHTAHLRLAEEAMRQLGLAAVLWIPAGQPKHRAAPAANPAQRLAMVRLAVAGRPEFPIDDTEIRADAPSYTVPTLERLRRERGDRRPLVLLMGADAFLGLPAWHRWRDLFGLAHIGVASRPTFELAAAAMPPELAGEWRSRRGLPVDLRQTPAGAIVDFPLAAGTVSSTEVRTRLHQGLAADQLLPGPVLDYIRRHRLYSD